MAGCKECCGDGEIITKRGNCGCGCEDETGECPACGGSGTAGCDNCGAPSRDADAYCSDTCKAACEGDESDAAREGVTAA